MSPTAPMTGQMISYEALATRTQSTLAKRLLSIIVAKKTNLCVSVDVTSPEELLSIVNKVGKYVCMVKTHIDILSEFPETLVPSLQDLAERYNFLIFEDRKFADIGNTVSLQYSAGIYCIVDWADIVTVHAVPGPGGVAGLKKAVGDRIRGGFLLVEMSSAGNLCTPEYRASALAIAQTHSDFVVGFIAMSPTHESFLTITPGVQLASKGDGLGQTYRDPKTVVKAGSDVIVVGRGITGANDVEEAAALYQREGWEGYLERINS